MILHEANDTVAEFRHFKRHQHLAREGQSTEAIYRVEEGWACRYRLLSSGRRQITALFLPGDYCEPQWLLAARSTNSIIALTGVRARRFALAEINGGTPGTREKMRALLGATLSALDRQSESIVTLGRKTAVERLCSILCDLFERLRNAGRVVNGHCVVPLTQVDLADLAGLTPVHVNRVLGVLRKEGLVELKTKDLHLPQPETLKSIGEGRLSIDFLHRLTVEQR